MKIHWNDRSFEPNLDGHTAEINGEKWEWVPQRNNRALLVGPHNTLSIDVVSVNREQRSVTIQYKGMKHEFKVSEPLDELLKSMGLDNAMQTKISELKAPMPGLVLDILVSPGQAVQKGDKLLVLEAMKMENAIKAPADAIIGAIRCEKGQAVDKNHALLSFD